MHIYRYYILLSCLCMGTQILLGWTHPQSMELSACRRRKKSYACMQTLSCGVGTLEMTLKFGSGGGQASQMEQAKVQQQACMHVRKLVPHISDDVQLALTLDGCACDPDRPSVYLRGLSYISHPCMSICTISSCTVIKQIAVTSVTSQILNKLFLSVGRASYTTKEEIENSSNQKCSRHCRVWPCCLQPWCCIRN